MVVYKIPFYTVMICAGFVLTCAVPNLSAKAEIHIEPAQDPSLDKASRPNLSGFWAVNKEQSDDAREKLKESMKDVRGMRSKSGQHGMGGGSGRGGGSGKGGGGGKKGGGKRTGSGQGRSGSSLQDMLLMFDAREALEITHEDPMLLITTEDGRMQRLFTDYRGIAISASGAIRQKLSTAGWEGDILVVETTDNNGTRWIQRYQLNAQSGQLGVSNEIRLPMLEKPVRIDRVYDSVSTTVP